MTQILRKPLGKETDNFLLLFTPKDPRLLLTPSAHLPRLRPRGCLGAGGQASISPKASAHQSQISVEAAGRAALAFQGQTLVVQKRAPEGVGLGLSIAWPQLPGLGFTLPSWEVGSPCPSLRGLGLAAAPH